MGMVKTLILDALRTTALTFGALFPIINPIGVAPIFLSLTKRYPDSIRKLLSRKISIYGFLLLGGSLALGSAILSYFGISLAIIQVAGGFVLANSGWTMLNQDNSDQTEPESSFDTKNALQRAFYPLTLPLTIGLAQDASPWRLRSEHRSGSRTKQTA